MVQHIVLAGGSGFLGRAIESRFVRDGWKVTVLTRNAIRPNDVAWDGHTTGAWCRTLDGAHALVNLTGKNVSCRHTPENRSEIIASRVNSVRALDAALAACAAPPPVWLQFGGIDILRDSPTAGDEHGSQAERFLANVCKVWEAEFMATRVTTRKVFFRVGPVLGHGGGPFPVLHRVTRLFAGGTVGTGRQHFSWVHIEDVVRMVAWAIANASASGTYNAVAPSPVSNRELMTAFRRSVGRPWAPPAPEIAVRLAARIIGVDADLLLGGSHGRPARLLAEGFEFRFAKLDDALADLMRHQ
jgi:hypothetical protein